MFYGAPDEEDPRALPEAATGKHHSEPAGRQDSGLTLSIQLGAGHRSPCQCGVRLAQLMQEKSYDKSVSGYRLCKSICLKFPRRWSKLEQHLFLDSVCELCAGF